MERGGSLALTSNQEKAQTHAGISSLLSPWELGKKQSCLFSHSPAHHNKSHMALGTWSQAEQGREQLLISYITAAPGQQRESALCSGSSGAHAQQRGAQTICSENVVARQT